jgi:tripartite-type tricarboxylate transporter receptor subunit TctC
MFGKALSLGLVAVLTASIAPIARAEYPEQPIKIIVAWPPGGVTDTVGRVVAEQLSRALRQTITVDNRAGANGIIGTQAAAKADPDGYTLQMMTAETHAINPYVYKNLPYNVKQHFEPIALMARSSFVLAAKASLQINNVNELIAHAKANPGKLSAASYGIGSTSHLALASFEKEAGLSFLHVPYRGVSPAVNALAAGDVDIAFVTPHIVVQLASAGQAKVLGSAALKRLDLAPDAPTFTEQGLNGFTGGNWYGVVAPKGTPPSIVKRLEAELRVIVASDVMKDYVRKTGVEIEFRDSKDFAAFLETEGQRLGEVVRDKKIELSQ